MSVKERTVDFLDLKKLVRDIPDFPKEGIVFKDITPLLKDRLAFQQVVDHFTSIFKSEKVDQVVGIESRGFILSAVLAYQLGAGFVPVRKQGKLPSTTESVIYQLEYGTDILEVHQDAIQKGDRVVVVDDLLATGGTCDATIQLVERLGGKIVGLAFLIELSFLNGRARLQKYPLHSLIQY